jgi:hypothetical protein
MTTTGRKLTPQETQRIAEADGRENLGAGYAPDAEPLRDGQEPPGDRVPADGPALRQLSTIPRRKVEWLWRPYLALGKDHPAQRRPRPGQVLRDGRPPRAGHGGQLLADGRADW